MDLTVTNKAPVAADTVRVTLAAADGGRLAAFRPGAHIGLFFAGFSRRYSLTSSPDDTGPYEICVLRTDSSRGGSAYIHDHLRVGDRLQGEGPFNAFHLNREARHSVFIAGGIGVTPFLSMMEALDRSSRPFELHYTARDAFRLLPVPDYSGRTRRYPNGRSRRLDIDAVLDPLSTEVDLYACGPHGLIEAVRAKAAARGWPDSRIHFESFGAGPRPTDAPIKIRLALSGSSIEVQPGTAILDALLANGIWAPYECRRGECASCVTEVISGEPDHRDLCLTADQRRNAMCTCVSWARTSEIVLNL
jgi:vanillate O-demethylase ferredoxin subunit